MSPYARHRPGEPKGDDRAGRKRNGSTRSGSASTGNALEQRVKTIDTAVAELVSRLEDVERILRHERVRQLERPQPERPGAPDARARTVVLGWLPALGLVTASGVLLCASANALSRSTLSSSQALFWLGLLAIYAPIVARLCATTVARGERIALILLLGGALYLVKVVRDPFAFTYADELAHLPNANSILGTHELFHDNPILPATASYPGLESIAAALAGMSGLSIFAAGLVVIAAARLVMILSLFLVFERLSSSARVAGLATALYAANANFVFFDAQFSYESLGLPLLLFALFAVTAWRHAEDDVPWSLVAFVATAAVVVTHHMSSYALTALLVAYTAVAYAFDRQGKSPWRFALFAAAATVLWLSTAAAATVGYLRPVFLGALASTFETLAGESAPRKLFAGSDAGVGVPIVEQATAVVSVLLLAAGVALGLRALLADRRREPLTLIFAGSSLALFAVFVLRFAPGAWETANRASEFLFVGVGFVVAVGLVSRAHLDERRHTAVVAGCAAVVFAGGVIAGWSPTERLARPYRVAVDGRTMEPVGRELARWAARYLGPDQRYAASDSDARLLAAYASGDAHFGRSPYIEHILQTPTLADWHADILSEYGLRYVVVDRRRRSFDNIAGYGFGLRTPTARRDELLPVGVAEKFDRIKSSRIYDAGVVRVYDLASSYLWATRR
jgi:hypothetical protein